VVVSTDVLGAIPAGGVQIEPGFVRGGDVAIGAAARRWASSACG
jgi:hypothetical protein